MSSLRNAISRRPHKERSQPTNRQKWGLLEKHKDYSLRAADYNSKRKKLDILAQKSRERHPDEFNFGMLRDGGQVQGRHGRRGKGDGSLGVERVRVLKGQDAGYLRGVGGRNRRELERAEEEEVMGRVLRRGVKSGEGKVVYGEDGEVVRPVKKRRVSDGSGDEDEGGMGMPRPTNAVDMDDDTQEVSAPKATPKIMSRKQLEKEKDRFTQLKTDRKRRKRLQELRANKLDVLRKRQKEILAAADELDLQRAKMGNVIGGTNKNGVKFKVRERKR